MFFSVISVTLWLVRIGLAVFSGSFNVGEASMSRAYRICVRDSVKRDLAASDEVCSTLEILEILPPEQMAELLRRELKGRGFAEEGDELVRRDANGITIAVDPKTGVVSVKAEKGETVELSGEKEGLSFDDVGPGQAVIRQGLKEQVREDLERRAANEQERMQVEVTEKLERHMDDVRQELGNAVNRVTAEALKEKAASLGEIREMTEDPETGSLTIKVEV